MDPKYEGTMSFIRSLPDDGKVLILPFTDSYIQVIHGLNKEGAYVGISTIGQLTGKKDFAGYVQMAPFSEVFWQLSKEKDYESIKRLLGLLNIRYIFYNSDTRIYDTTFPAGPYSPNYVRKYMPPNQNGYKGFIKNLSSEKVFENGFYSLYKTEQKVFLPHFYTAGEILSYNDDPQLNDYGKASAFFPNKKTNEIRVAYIENEICKEIFPREKCDKDKILKLPSGPKILFEKINPTKYKIRVSNAKNPYILVFSEAFHKNWKVFISDKPQEKTVIRSYFDGEVKEGEHKNIFLDKNIFETFPLKPISEDTHFIVNGYANGWYIKSQDLKGSQEYELIVEMTGQRVFYISLILSGIVFIGLVLWGIKLFVIIRTKNK